MPLRVLALLALLGTVAVSAQAARRAAARTVPCFEIIDHPAFPYVGSNDPARRYRLVLGVVSVPPAYLAQVVETNERPWAYWRKAGLVVRAGSGPITISVPPASRRRAAIIWGYGNHPPVAELRIPRCGSNPAVGNAYSGGFLLGAPACVPLTFRVGNRSATVRFGVGRRCS
jgi:hypothetical protein